MKKIIMVLLTFLCLSAKSNTIQALKLASPKSVLTVNVYINKEDKLCYNVLMGTKVVLKESPLGLKLHELSFDNNLTIADYSTSNIIIENIQMLIGKKKSITVSYNEGRAIVKNKAGNVLELIFRAYDDGIAFRYKLNGAKEQIIQSELSGFNIPQGKAWLMPYDDPGAYTPAYESYYIASLNSFTSQSPTKSGWAFPSLFSDGNTWILLTEADINETYCSSHLNSPKEGIYTIRFPEKREAGGLYSAEPKIVSDWQSPWRVIMVGKELNAIVENNLVQALASPSKIEDTSWIQPGIASWSWWWDDDSPEDFNKLKEYIDFGHSMGWKHSLIDAKWHLMKGGSIEALCKYADDKNVNLWVWYNSGGPHNDYDLGPRDLLHLPELRQKEFERISKIGIKGIKVDYIESDKQEIIKLYIDILKDAAQYKLMVNFHGCKLPTGLERTFPNLLTMEAVKGAEGYKLDPTYPDRAAVCNTILPYTRNVVGPMDYTPTTFSNHLYPHLTSLAHELALSVIFESGVQHMADDYKMYDKQEDFVKDFLKKLPSTWDKTLFVSGYPGENIVMSRKNMNRWFIAGIFSKKHDTTYVMKFPFLSKKIVQLTLITDSKSDNTFKKQVYRVNKNSKIPINIKMNGGFCGTIDDVF
jgi:alpha-glucosidase